jgi:hypothetical protein
MASSTGVAGNARQPKAMTAEVLQGSHARWLTDSGSHGPGRREVNYHSSVDFRDHAIKKAVDDAVGPYRPEKRLRPRIARIAIVAALTLATCVGFWAMLHYSSTKHAKPAAKPIAVELLPAPAKP